MKYVSLIVCVVIVVYFYFRITNGLRKIRRPYSKSTHSSSDDAGEPLWFGTSADESSHHGSGHADCSAGGDSGGSGDCGGDSGGGGDGGDSD
jgi:uncharacterized membrane protein YgcG